MAKMIDINELGLVSGGADETGTPSKKTLRCPSCTYRWTVEYYGEYEPTYRECPSCQIPIDSI